jgi:hypothetical protein
MILDFADAPAKSLAIKELEHAGDVLTHDVVRRINTTFVTPFDREDVHALASRLDGVLDQDHGQGDHPAQAGRRFLRRDRRGVDAHRTAVAGIPVSTTRTITEAIVGVGATTRLSAVRWGIAGRILWAWILTVPAAALIGGVSSTLVGWLR